MDPIADVSIDRAIGTRGVMHKHLTHNKCWRDYPTFAQAVLWFLRDKVPRCWEMFRDSVTDNFRVINPKDFRVIA